MKRVAIFTGTFDPFTVGHHSIVERSLPLFDEVIIAIGINEMKKGYFPLEKRMEMIESLYSGNPKVKVQSYNSLTVDFARQVSAKWIVRGIRSVSEIGRAHV